MDRQFTEQDILNAKELCLFDNRVLYLITEDDEAYGFTGGAWFYKSNFWDYFESESMLSYLSMPTKEEAVALYRAWRNAADMRS
ncbi:MAG: hypothetical protein IJC93_01360 [Clostridia bacterium]|nr:hypothetical protein [Clostridia bacterium]